MKDYPHPDETKYMQIGLTVGMCIGIGIGMVLGAVFDNLTSGMCTGIGVGMSLGICVGSLMDAKKRKETANTQPSDEQTEEDYAG